MSRSSALAAVVVSLAVANGCGARSARIDPALATMVPHDAYLLAGVRLDKLRDTPAWRDHLSRRDLPALDDAARECGIDLRRDIWEVLIVASGQDVVAMAKGKFADQSAEPRVSPNVRRTPYKGYTLLGSGRASLVFINNSTIVAGPPNAVIAILDQRGRATGPPRALAEKIRTIPPQDQAWLAATGGTVPNVPGNAANLARMLSMAESATVAARFAEGVNVNGEIVARSADDAISLEGGMRGLLTLVRISTRDKELQRAAEGVKIEKQDRTIKAHMSLTGGQLSRLLGPS